MEESEAAEAKARAEQAAKEMAQVQTVESGINRQNVLQAGRDSNTKGSLKNANDSTNKTCIGGGASVESAFKRNSCYAAEGSEGHKADTDAKNKNITKDGNGEKVALAPIANSDCTSQLQDSNNVEAEMMKNNDVETQEGSKGGNVKGASNGEDDTEDGRNEKNKSGNVGSNAEAVNCCEAEESVNHGNNERVEHTEDDKAHEANPNENSANVEIHGDGDGEAKESDINAEQSQADGGSNNKAEDAEHNENTKVDGANSSKNGTAENGKTDVDVKGNSDGTAEGSPA